jgi:hypothetical protein
MDNPRGSTYNPSTIFTYSRRYVDPFNLDPDEVVIQDITHALSMKARFGGMAPKFYSVAQHSVEVSLWLTGENLITQLAGLLHDTDEAYLPDLPRPIKSRPEFAALRQVESDNLAIILTKFLDPHWERRSSEIDWDKVVLADNDVLRSECISLCACQPEDWGLKHPSVYRPVFPLTPREAKLLFEDRYLFLKRGIELEQELFDSRGV